MTLHIDISQASRGGRRIRHAAAAIAAAALLAGSTPDSLSAAQQAQSTEPAESSAESSAQERFQSDVQWLSADEREGRGAGTSGLTEAAHWLAARFEELGLEPAGDSGGFLQALSVRLPGDEIHNAVGIVESEAADRLPGTVIIGAHYDHLGFGGEGSLEPDQHVVHNGADDNASGTAALLEVARGLMLRRDQLRRDIVLVAFSGEEGGLIGSSMFVHAPPQGVELSSVVAMLNMDMVGRLRDDRLAVLGGESAVEWVEIVEPLCVQRDLQCSITDDGFGASDHSSFYAAGIPVLHFFTGAHPEYHKPSDDAALINAAGGVRVADLVLSVAVEMSRREAPLSYVKSERPASEGRMAGGGARLGTIPDYAGSPDGLPGVLLSAVRSGGPAEAGGLRRGDLIVQIDTTVIGDIEDFMMVLQSATPGQKAEITVIRDGERVALDVTYGSRN
ncbi:MAG: M28 family peptidase [Gemmatimonadota bacterium]